MKCNRGIFLKWRMYRELLPYPSNDVHVGVRKINVATYYWNLSTLPFTPFSMYLIFGIYMNVWPKFVFLYKSETLYIMRFMSFLTKLFSFNKTLNTTIPY